MANVFSNFTYRFCVPWLIFVGGDNNIAVVLGIYQLPVSCRGKIAHWEACREILWGMRADNVPRAFGPRSDPDVTEPLPHSVDSSKYLTSHLEIKSLLTLSPLQ